MDPYSKIPLSFWSFISYIHDTTCSSRPHTEQSRAEPIGKTSRSDAVFLASLISRAHKNTALFSSVQFCIESNAESQHHPSSRAGIAP
jgi:hypothetical protein